MFDDPAYELMKNTLEHLMATQMSLGTVLEPIFDDVLSDEEHEKLSEFQQDLYKWFPIIRDLVRDRGKKE